MGKQPGGSSAAVREEKEDVFQAVLLADSFGDSIFGPVWAEKRYPNRNNFGSDEEEDGVRRGEAAGGDTVDGSSSFVDQRLSQEVLARIDSACKEF